MTPVLVERYAKDGSEKARRQMLALCQTDPDILADVLGHLVEMASQKLNESTVRFDLFVIWTDPVTCSHTASDFLES